MNYPAWLYRKHPDLGIFQSTLCADETAHAELGQDWSEDPASTGFQVRPASQLHPTVYNRTGVSRVYVGAEGLPYILGKTTSDEMDQIRPYWRSLHYRPTALIHYDTSVEFDCIPDTSYTVNLEVYRLPMVPMSSDDDIPEINAMHHRHLVKWAKHRAYAKRDADTYNEGLSEKYLTEFEDVFGKRPNAAYRKGANANRPHRNILW